MPLVPSRLLFRLNYPCPYVRDVPSEDGDDLVDLPESCRLDNFAAIEGRQNFADVRLAWNELGLAVQAEVRGKEQSPQGDASRARGSDGLTLWIDTRGDRTSHRATRYCHQFHLLPVGGGSDSEDAAFVQSKINRALQDAPLASSSAVALRRRSLRGGYRLEAFLPAAVLHGFDPEQNRRLGVFYAVRDLEKGEQTLSLDSDFPYGEDPSLWAVLELTGGPG